MLLSANGNKEILMLYKLKIIKEIQDADYFKVVDININGNNHRLHLVYDYEKLRKKNNIWIGPIPGG